MNPSIENKASEKAKLRYNRIARMYDASEAVVEWVLFRRWRRRLWMKVPSGYGLEVGVGTGKNIPYYPRDSKVVAIDFSSQMLERARRRATRLRMDVDMREMDVEQLAFPDNTFDWAVATFVFCSVPDPIQGLQELRRVVKPDGDIFLLEHVRIDKPVLCRLMDFCNPVAVRLTGANINRQTVKNVEASRLKIESMDDLGLMGVAKLVVAHS